MHSHSPRAFWGLGQHGLLGSQILGLVRWESVSSAVSSQEQGPVAPSAPFFILMVLELSPTLGYSPHPVFPIFLNFYFNFFVL